MNTQSFNIASAVAMKGLDNDQLVKMAPSVGQIFPKPGSSERYCQLPTLPIIDMLRTHGWKAINAREVNTRVKERMGYQRHLVRFVHESVSVSSEDLMSVLLINSHDATCAYRLITGIFRIVCSNGLVVGWRQCVARLSHIGHDEGEVEKLSEGIAQSSSQIAKDIDRLRDCTLTSAQEHMYAQQALKLFYRHRTNKDRVDISGVLNRHRQEDDDKTLWNVYNVVQENCMNGLHYKTKKGQRRKAKAITSIQREVGFNKQLAEYTWTYMRQLKAA